MLRRPLLLSPLPPPLLLRRADASPPLLLDEGGKRGGLPGSPSWEDVRIPRENSTMRLAGAFLPDLPLHKSASHGTCNEIRRQRTSAHELTGCKHRKS